jgi:predicted Holliday junction resolvase-like endonuclease
MDFFGVETPRDICNIILGLGGGAGLTWLVLSLAFRFRLRKATKIAAESALQRSRHVLKGQAAEQLAPLSAGFPYLPNDSRFLGSPIDYLVFDGLSEDQELEIVFLEVKSGRAKLSKREAKIREAVMAGRVRWEELRL